MAVAINADAYAFPRQNIFFTGVVPSLDGQCVSLVKWFMEEMSSVPNPQAARGDARYVGKTLVAQGHAREVPYAERQRGDIICYEYGIYGHIAVQLSDGRVFEQNVNMSGVASKIVDGARVYASRIGSENETWRNNQHVYRLNSYSEGGDDMINNTEEANLFYRGVLLREAENESVLKPNVGKPWHIVMRATLDSQERKNLIASIAKAREDAAKVPGLEKRIKELEAQVGAQFTPYGGKPLYTKND